MKVAKWKLHALWRKNIIGVSTALPAIVAAIAIFILSTTCLYLIFAQSAILDIEDGLEDLQFTFSITQKADIALETDYIDLGCDASDEYARFQRSGGAQATACPDTSEWMKLFAAEDPSPNKTAIVIGCNKGADAVDIFAMFDNAATPFESDSWRQAVLSTSGSLGGACGQIAKSPHLDRGRSNAEYEQTSPTVFCVEPMRENVALLRNTVDKTGIDQNAFHVQQFAVGKPAEGQNTIGFPDGSVGSEALRVMNSGSAGGTEVEFKSLDALFGALDSVVDILSVDTEGSDPDVLFAGRKTLRKTRYLEFEVHRDLSGTPWSTTTLLSVIKFLDQQDLEFDCFWANGNGELFQITRCWDEQYETASFHWSNVVCAKRSDPWHRILMLRRADQMKRA